MIAINTMYENDISSQPRNGETPISNRATIFFWGRLSRKMSSQIGRISGAEMFCGHFPSLKRFLCGRIDK